MNLRAIKPSACYQLYQPKPPGAHSERVGSMYILDYRKLLLITPITSLWIKYFSPTPRCCAYRLNPFLSNLQTQYHFWKQTMSTSVVRIISSRMKLRTAILNKPSKWWLSLWMTLLDPTVLFSLFLSTAQYQHLATPLTLSLQVDFSL